MPRTKKINIDGSEYTLHSLTRGEIKKIIADCKGSDGQDSDGQDSDDELVSMSLKCDDTDSLDSLAFRKLVQASLDFNGLLPDSVSKAKKN